MAKDKELKCGMEVKDPITGFTGVIMSITEYLNGCRRICVQPKIADDGKIPEPAIFDELQIDIISNKFVKIEKDNVSNDKGGPDKFITSLPSINHKR